MKGWSALMIAGLVVTLAACSSGAGVARTGDDTPASWVGGSDSWEVLLSLTRAGTVLSGSADTVTLNGTSATPAHASVAGTVAGTAVTLTFTGGFFARDTFSGTLKADALTLQSPSDAGQIQLITLHPGTVDDYNRAVTALQSKASANASASAQAVQEQASASQATAAQQQVATDADAFWKAVDDANSAIAAGHDFSDFDKAVAQAQHDLAQARTDAANAANEPDRVTACSDAITANSDAISVNSDQITVQGLVTGFNQSETGFSDTIDQVPERLQQYKTDSASGYSAANPPTQKAVDGVTSQATTLVDEWNTKISGYTTTVKSVLDQANAVAATAKKTYCTD